MPTRRRADPQPPDEREWNFTPVPKEELSWCVLWEYARSSPGNWVEVAVKDWFSRKLNDNSTVLTLFRNAPSLCTNSRLAEAFDLRPSSLVPPQPTDEIIKGDFDLRPIRRLGHLLSHLPFFPKPWQSIHHPLRTEAIQLLADKHIAPIGRPIPPLSIYGKDDMAFWFLYEFLTGPEHPDWTRFEDHVLHIDWDNYDRKKIKAEFERWLSAEAKKRLTQRRHGSRQTPFSDQSLKYLCALRLKDAGLSFTQIQDLLKSLPRRNTNFLPIHDSSSTFSSDVRRAKSYKAEWFPLPPKS